MKILVPWAASASAVAAPIPRLAPVMRTTLSLSRVSITILASLRPRLFGRTACTFDCGLGAAVDELAVREDRPVEIPRQKPMEEWDTLGAPAVQQQPE